MNLFPLLHINSDVKNTKMHQLYYLYILFGISCLFSVVNAYEEQYSKNSVISEAANAKQTLDTIKETNRGETEKKEKESRRHKRSVPALPEDYNQLNDRLFNPHADKLNTDETLRQLKKFVDLNVDYFHKSEYKRRHDAMEILYHCDSTNFFCDISHIEKYNLLLEREKDYVNTIIPLIQKCRQDYVNGCVEKLDQKTLTGADKIPSDVKDKLNILRSKVLDSASLIRDQDPHIDITIDDLAQGLASYLRTEEPDTSSDADYQTFKRKLSNLIIGQKGFCYNVSGVRQSRDFIDMMIHENLIDKVSPETREWITKADMCWKMDLNCELLMSKVHVTLLSNREKGDNTINGLKSGQEKKSGLIGRVKGKFVNTK